MPVQAHGHFLNVKTQHARRLFSHFSRFLRKRNFLVNIKFDIFVKVLRHNDVPQLLINI
jgi:hypothetical protein